MSEATLAAIDGAVASAGELLGELCAISSESGNVAGLRRVAERLGAELERHGLAVAIEVADDTAQPLLLAASEEAGDQPLLLLGHLDTVLPASIPRHDGERLVATGALDMKGGLAMLVGALDVLAARDEAPPGDLLLLAVPDEEVGGEIAQPAVRRWGERARAVLVLEPGEGRAGGETIVAGRRGLTEWTLTATGRAAHSGLAYWQGRSALTAAADWSLRAAALSRADGGPTVNVARLLAGSAGFVDALATQHDLLGSSRQRNVVPDRALAEGEARYLSSAAGREVVAALAALAREVGAAHEVELAFATGTAWPPVDPGGAGSALVARLVALAAARGLRLEIETDRGGISFPNYLSDPSRVPVLDGLGPVGGGMHTREEWVDLGSFRRRVLLLADLLAELCR
ncbi:MAG TPA: M20/M25/M40 family metallo-hydrolase [Thermoanaerobaculia bacterium]|nr:M20/M25/M40 family metallo-hydrolase [Thermoanaerobaculia bacterium]